MKKLAGAVNYRYLLSLLLSILFAFLIGAGILGLNYTHAAAKKIGPKQARVMHRVFCGVTGLGMAMHVFAVKQPKE